METIGILVLQDLEQSSAPHPKTLLCKAFEVSGCWLGGL